MILPEPTPRTLPFWDAAGHGKLLLPRCRHCRAWLHPQDEACPLGHVDHGWAEASGTGTILAAATVHRTAHPGLPAPYTLLVVRLDEGPQLISSLYRGRRPAPGTRVGVVFDDVTRDGTAGSTLPRFAPLDQARRPGSFGCRLSLPSQRPVQDDFSGASARAATNPEELERTVARRQSTSGDMAKVGRLPRMVRPVKLR